MPLAIMAMVISLATFFLSRQSHEIAYVEINKVLDGYERTKIERLALSDKTKGLKSNVDSLLTNWQNELKAFEKERLGLSKNELELKQKVLEQKQQQISNYQNAIQLQIQEEDKKTTQTVINDINDYIQQYGKDHGYKMIFGANGNGNIMYAEDGIDLTEKVIQGINKKFNGK